MIGDITINSSKIDSEATLGLTGTSNSLAYRVHEIENHFHSVERWVGIRGSQTGTDWGVDTSITPFQAISGNNTYGADANDEALVLGTGDLPIVSGGVKTDIQRLFIIDSSVDTRWKLRIIYGSGTMAAAIAAGQYTEIITQIDATNPQLSTTSPVEIRIPRFTSGTDQIWVQGWNATDNATIDFLVGVHEYEG